MAAIYIIEKLKIN